MNELNKMCSCVCESITGVETCLYSYDLMQTERKKAKIYKEEIDKVINIGFINECLKNAKENYYVLYYLILYENEITEKLKEQICFALLDNMDGKGLKPILDITMLNIELTDNIVKKIIEITNEEFLRWYRHSLGNEPFDYRYHILKRKEISDELKEIILERYEFSGNYYNDDVERKIYYDICDEYNSKYLRFGDDISKYKNLQNEVRAYELIKAKKDNKNKVKMNKK